MKLSISKYYIIHKKKEQDCSRPTENIKVYFIIPHGGDLLKTAEIKLNENAVYRVIDGKLEKVDVPGDGFGKQVITWQNGKPTHYEVSYTKR